MLRAGYPDAASASTSSADTQQYAQESQQNLYATLNEYLLLEPKFQPRLCLPNDDGEQTGEVTKGARDGAAHVLRCLKVWYDLPPDVLINAINLFDRFLTKMKVRPCHVPCITVACMNIALDQHAEETNTPRTVSVNELVSISQWSCTAHDVARMSRVVRGKLALAGAACAAPHAWPRLLLRVCAATATTGATALLPQESELINLLEILMCDSSLANQRPSELALVLIFLKLEQRIGEWTSSGKTVPEETYDLYEIGAQIQAHCRMSDSSVATVCGLVRGVLAAYESRAAAPCRQRLVWRLSTRTLKVLRPTDRLTSLLPTIEEQHYSTEGTPTRKRSGSETEEETSDWPRSPVLPVYCDN